MPEKIKWGIIGPGKIAEKFAQDLLLVDDAVLYGVASRDANRSADFAKKYRVARAFDSYKAMVTDPEVDIIYVATPHVFHFEQTMLCLRSGKAVLCEKPFGMNAREVKIMTGEARARNLFLMEALWTRFIPGTEKLLELIQKDTIGKIQYVKADFGFLGDGNKESRVYNPDLGAGSLLDIGIYPVYLSLLLLGIPDQIKAVVSFTDTGVDSFCAILFDYLSGEKAFSESSILSNTPIEAFIYGDKGSIKMHSRFHHTEKLTLQLNNNTTETFHCPYIGNGYYHEIKEVMDCLKQGKTESEKMPHSMSLDLILTLDKIREMIGLKYKADD
ncbi:MAG: Gfo/Idh/MocA family oxidoreductase [Lentimicrobium sp.]|nr:Gfo/Idh/MocA family oxidoreductase [Lentimicrobium sp.]